MQKKTTRTQRRVQERARKKVKQKAATKNNGIRKQSIRYVLAVCAVVFVGLMVLVLHNRANTTKGIPQPLVTSHTFPRDDMGSTKEKLSPVESEITESELWDRIHAIEASFLEFEKGVKKRIDAIENQYLKEQLSVPFAVLRENMKNESRNYMKLVREAQGDSFSRVSNINFFFYSPEEVMHKGPYEKMHISASYTPVSREMSLAQGPFSYIDNIIFFHELYHVVQDTGTRSTLKTKEQFDNYLAFLIGTVGEKPRIVINIEFTAYGMELELVNILLDGYLLDIAVKGKRPDPKIVAKGLNASDDQLSIVRFLCDLSEKYFPEGITYGGYTPRFSRFVGSLYENRGYELYISDTGNFKDRKRIFANQL